MYESFKPITTFVFDVDGVLTNGTLLLLPGGEMARSVNIKDGYAIQLAVKKGYKVVIISGGLSDLVKERFEKLGVQHVYMRVQDKKKVLLDYLATHSISKNEVLFMGDDLPDLEVMGEVGLPCCPQDACTEIKEMSRYVSPFKGGEGCGRDIIEKVMKLQGKWLHEEGVASR